jgi:hypothetical protein
VSITSAEIRDVLPRANGVLENFTGVWLCGSTNSGLGLPKRRGDGGEPRRQWSPRLDLCPEPPYLEERGLELCEYLESLVAVERGRAHREHGDRPAAVFDELGHRQIGHR